MSPLPVEKTTRQMICELNARREWFGVTGPPLSIYLGGGTPSLWPADDLAQVIASCVDGAPHAEIEITVELNPGDVDSGWISTVMAAGVNRFSVGVQAMTDDRLRWLGRRHSVADAQQAVDTLKRCGAQNISVDFMYATPDLTASEMVIELHHLCDLDVAHVSAYELTVAEGTPLFLRNLEEIPNEARAGLWHKIGETLLQHGFDRYEVSNYARGNEHRSRHNGHYWNGGAYIGIGSGAHGFVISDDRRIRYGNGATFTSWVEEPASTDTIERKVALGDGFFETISDLDYARELMMLGLRCSSGVNAGQLEPLIRYDDRFRCQLSEFLQLGWLTYRDEHYVPSTAAMLMADELALRFF